MAFGVDIELTNRCNAVCNFCPRDQTPHTGLMSPEVFAKSLERTLELREAELSLLDEGDVIRGKVNFCGLGEPMLNRNAPDFIRQVRESGLDCHMSSNGALLDERRGHAVLEAGLQGIWINAGATGELYEKVYGLPFEKTLRNVVQFAEMAGDRCEVHIVLVDFQHDPDHVKRMREFWESQGISSFLQFEIMNRGGALFVDDMQYEAMPERTETLRILEERDIKPFCAVPFIFLFVGYDGQYYLCCSDWKKEVPLGSVFDHSFHSIVAKKLEHTASRSPICKTCNHDPLNRVTEALHYAGGTPDEQFERLLEATAEGTAAARSILHTIDPTLDFDGVADRAASSSRRTIPVTSL
jgi:MoaA/NifB/PqqE/SkfB family radical SAM enzyme